MNQSLRDVIFEEVKKAVTKIGQEIKSNYTLDESKIVKNASGFAHINLLDLSRLEAFK
jgi:hypothetical protein